MCFYFYTFILHQISGILVCLFWENFLFQKMYKNFLFSVLRKYFGSMCSVGLCMLIYYLKNIKIMQYRIILAYWIYIHISLILIIVLLDPRPTDSPIKSPFSISLFVRQFGVFLRNGSLVFSDFLRDDRLLEYLKTDRALFPR